MIRALKYTILISVFALAGTTYAYANIARLVFVNYTSLQALDENVYVSPGLSSDDKAAVMSLLASSRKRIGKHFGDAIARPVIAVLSTDEEKANYGLNDHPGIMFFAPWQSYLLLAQQDMSTDVTAHELVHAEVVERVGYLKRQLDIPTWFDEGAAMQVDYRPKYTVQAKISSSEFKRVIKLDTASKFWTRDKDQNIENYRGSKSAFSELSKNSDFDLYSILSEVRAGNINSLEVMIKETNNALLRASR